MARRPKYQISCAVTLSSVRDCRVSRYPIIIAHAEIETYAFIYKPRFSHADEHIITIDSPMRVHERTIRELRAGALRALLNLHADPNKLYLYTENTSWPSRARITRVYL